jgi:hypothetical protein
MAAHHPADLPQERKRPTGRRILFIFISIGTLNLTSPIASALREEVKGATHSVR